MEENIKTIQDYEEEVASIVPVVKYIPGGDNHLLTVPSASIAVVDDEVIDIAHKLEKTLYFYNALGISAPQIGIHKRIICVLNYPNTNIITMINPQIVDNAYPMENGMEGCLSFPDIAIAVLRPNRVLVRYTDLSGDEHEKEFIGLLARAVYHEVDHLDGVLMIDNVSPMKRGLVLDKMKKQIRTGKVDNDKIVLEYLKRTLQDQKNLQGVN